MRYAGSIHFKHLRRFAHWQIKIRFVGMILLLLPLVFPALVSSWIVYVLYETEFQVDFILLGGDLFHENKPSRSTLVKTIEILRRYCLNDQPVKFQVVSDQTVNFPNRFGQVNYEDPNFNVGLPVFTIHGNHDDPAGVDNLSAIDILSACNLVNYFGKMDLGGSGVGQIAVYPVLIKKGITSVALYGLGNIRDERLNRMFQTPHSVQWMRPGTQDGDSVSDWFNILVLHQNRIKTNPKSAINEHFLPRFLDFVVWGHEHECLVDPQEVPGMGFHITQPGSSVATSLIDGEAKPKHVLLLEIKVFFRNRTLLFMLNVLFVVFRSLYVS